MTLFWYLVLYEVTFLADYDFFFNFQMKKTRYFINISKNPDKTQTNYTQHWATC